MSIAYEGKHRGKGVGGAKRGKREKAPTNSDTYMGHGAGNYSELALGHMAPAHMMGMHEHIRQEMKYGEHSRAMVSGANSSTGGRREAFMAAHRTDEDLGAGARANAAAWSNNVSGTGKVKGRTRNFQTGRANFRMN